jgi:hypothetical protein
MSNLLKGMNKLSNENQNMDIIAPSLDVIEQVCCAEEMFM